MRIIKNLKTKSRIFLAPMEEVNDVAFRVLCKKAGAGLTYTGMIHPLTQQKLELQDKPALQLFSTIDKGISEFIKKYDSKVSLWDFNLGCPAKTAKRDGFGYFLCNNLETIEQIIKAMRSSTKKPVTIKLRKHKNTFRIARLAEKLGVDAIAIHPRTQAQGYSGIPDEDYAENLRRQLSIPVIYSGNVTKENANELLKKFDYVMIGRESIGRPQVFSKTKKEFSFNDYIKLAEKYNFPFRQIKFQAMNFTKGKENATELRLEIFKCKTMKELEKIKTKF